MCIQLLTISIINYFTSILFVAEVANGQVNFEPNLSQFVRRFDAASTHGQGMEYSSSSTRNKTDCISLLSSPGPSWLKNLYFTYLVVLRAVTKAGTYWEDQSFYTGDTSRDILVKEKIMTIVNAAK